MGPTQENPFFFYTTKSGRYFYSTTKRKRKSDCHYSYRQKEIFRYNHLEYFADIQMWLKVRFQEGCFDEKAAAYNPLCVA